jgi:rfaE bifunctional protein kinase chain/domain
MMDSWAGLSGQRLQALLGRYADRRIGVVGDLALDAYWYADMTRAFLSRETPHFPRPVVREMYSAGAGANVAHNLRAVGVGKVVVFSVLGEDWRGRILSGVLASLGIDLDHLITSSDRSTSAYIKPILQGYDSQQEDSRLDFENDRPLSSALEDSLIEAIRRQLPNLDALLISDQLEMNGIVTERVRDALNGLAVETVHTPFVVDSRRRIGLFHGMILKPNQMEAVLAAAPARDPQSVQRDDLTHLGNTLSAQSGRPAFITLGDDGVLVCADGQHRHLPAAPVQPPLDLVGAGDAFISALTAALAVGATPWEAGAIANLAAAVVVEKLNQTGTASPDEILARYELARTKEPTS